MSLETSLERIATALETLAATDLSQINESVTPAHAPEPVVEKPKRTRKKKVKAEPEVAESPTLDLAAVPTDDTPPEASTEAELKLEGETATPTPEELNKGLMDLAKGASPDVVNQIFQVLAQVGAKNTTEVPENRRVWVLETAAAVVAKGGGHG